MPLPASGSPALRRSRGPKKLWEQRSPAELPGGARRLAPATRPPPSRILSERPSVPVPPKLNRESGARGARWRRRRHGAQFLGPADFPPGAVAGGDAAGARGGGLLPPLFHSFSVHSPRGAGRRWGAGRKPFPCTLRATPPTTFRDKNTMVGTSASPLSPASAPLYRFPSSQGPFKPEL